MMNSVSNQQEVFRYTLRTDCCVPQCCSKEEVNLDAKTGLRHNPTIKPKKYNKNNDDDDVTRCVEVV